jgi:hypothetical protein
LKCTGPDRTKKTPAFSSGGSFLPFEDPEDLCGFAGSFLFDPDQTALHFTGEDGNPEYYL